MTYTRGESLEDIVMSLECLKFSRQMRYKYHQTRIGFAFDDTARACVIELKERTRMHKKVFGESIDVRLLETIV